MALNAICSKELAAFRLHILLCSATCNLAGEGEVSGVCVCGGGYPREKDTSAGSKSPFFFAR